MGEGLPVDAAVLAGAALLGTGVLIAGLADRVRVPGLLLFLGLGMLIGDDGLNLISLADPRLAQNAGAIALLAILFQGGLATKPSDLRRASLPGALLATVGVLVTAAVTAGGVLLLLRTDVFTALLVGAVTASTDAAAVFSVLRKAPLPPRITSLLEVESGANDPLAIVLTLGVLEYWSAQPGPLELLTFGVVQLVGGVVVGLAVGVTGSWILRQTELGAGSLYPILALAIGGLAYGLAAVAGGSGFFAVYLAGLCIGALVPRHRRTLRSFHEGLANTAEIALFLLLGLLVFPSRLVPVVLPALGVAVVLVLLARPLAVTVCLLPVGFRPAELALVSWAGLRGAVPIVLATFPLTAGYPRGELIFNIVFFVVLISTALQGVTVAAVARRLGLQVDARPWSPVADALPLEGIDIDLIEVDITEQLPVCGKRLREVPLPGGALATALLRRRRVLLPNSNTRLSPGDLLLVAVPRSAGATREIVAWAKGEAPREAIPQ